MAKSSQMSSLVLFSGLLAASCTSCVCSEQTPSVETTARNVVVLSIDNVSRSKLRAFNPRASNLPNLDRFSKRAARFDNAYSPASWTLPAHASLMTGLYPDRHGAADPHNRISSTLPTLAMVLREAGFETVAFTDGGLLDRRYGFSRGFDKYDEWTLTRHWRQGLKLPRDGRPNQVSADDLFDRAITFLSNHRPDDPPFFLFLHTFAVHDYFETTSKLVDDSKIRENLRECLTDLERCSQAEWDALQDLYDAGLLADEGFGRLIAALDENEFRDSTLCFVISDHGEGFEYARRRVHHAGRLHEDLIRVPLLVLGPDIAPLVEKTPVSLVDIMPTVLDIFEISLETSLDGTSFAGNLYPSSPRAFTAVEPSRTVLSMEHAYRWEGGSRIQARSAQTRPHSIAVIRDDLWYIRDPSGEELYDMKVDPKQADDLALAFARLPMFRAVADERLKFRTPVEKFKIDKELEERLRSLGYLR